jgi:hypothetical protein
MACAGQASPILYPATKKANLRATFFFPSVGKPKVATAEIGKKFSNRRDL